MFGASMSELYLLIILLIDIERTVDLTGTRQSWYRTGDLCQMKCTILLYQVCDSLDCYSDPY